MAIKEGNKIISVTLTPIHEKKLRVLCSRSGLSKTQVIQRLLEQYKLMEIGSMEEESPSTPQVD